MIELQVDDRTVKIPFGLDLLSFLVGVWELLGR
jgi:hypothetical protein